MNYLEISSSELADPDKLRRCTANFRLHVNFFKIRVAGKTIRKHFKLLELIPRSLQSNEQFCHCGGATARGSFEEVRQSNASLVLMFNAVHLV